MDNANIEKYILEFILEYREQYLNEKKKLPYHINLLEEIKVDENAHSRILEKLLQQETPCGKFEILESFLQFCGGKSASFGNICFIRPPDITQNKKHIDLWIRDKNMRYAIIVENKIHRKEDEKRQLFRYIKTTEEYGYDRKNIFVIYLSSTYGNAPDKQTWGEGEENCKEEFKNRYLHLSFREDILTWLSDYVLPNVRLKDKYLSSALEQYIDHLKFWYSLRDINKKMNMELQKLIKDTWKLTGSSQENLDQLEEKKEIVNNINLQIESLIRQEKFKRWEENIPRWKEALKEQYSSYKPSKDKWPGVYIPGEDIPIINDATKEIYVSLWADDSKSDVDYNKSGAWCVLNCFEVENRKPIMPPTEIINKIEHLLWANPDPKLSQMQNSVPLDEYDELYSLLKSVVNTLTAQEP